MAFFDWTEEYSVNIDFVDTQHKRLFEYINELHSSMESGSSAEVLGGILNGLVEYAVMHFGAEEKAFVKYKYPGYESHKQEHDQLLGQVGDYVERFNKGDQVTVELLGFLIEWLDKHIKGTDKKYTQFLLDAGEKPARSAVPTSGSGGSDSSYTSSRPSLSRRIVGGVGAIMVMLLGVVWFNIHSLESAVDGYSNLIHTNQGISHTLAEIETALLKAENAQKDYTATADIEFAQQHSHWVGEMREHAVEFAELSVGRNGSVEAKGKLVTLTNQYDAAFQQVVPLLEAKGGTDRGIIGDFRAAVHKLESIVQGAGSNTLQNELLMLRRHEKDYLLRKDPKYVVRVQKQAERLKDRVEDYIPESKVATATLLIEKYKKGFNSVVDVDRKIDESIVETNKIVHKIEPHIEEIKEKESRMMKDESSNLQNSAEGSIMTSWAVSVVGLIIGLLGGVLIARSITTPIRKTVALVKEIAEGDGNLKARLDVTSNDEIGEMAELLNSFISKTHKIILQVSYASKKLGDTAEDLKNASSTMVTASGDMTKQTSTATEAVERSSSNVRDVAAATGDMSTTVNHIAAAVEELSASFNEVTNNCAKASTVAFEANTKAGEAGETIHHLSDSSHEIHKVLDTIKDIADQTKLLALNATIEAAAAGDAGKGFAVVADEVKELAKQTNTATDDIAQQIQSMTGSIGGAVTDISKIREVISELNDISQSIATAATEQSATIDEVAGNLTRSAKVANDVDAHVKEVSTATSDISSNIIDIDRSADDTSSNATKTNAYANDLSQLAVELDSYLSKFQL